MTERGGCTFSSYMILNDPGFTGWQRALLGVASMCVLTCAGEPNMTDTDSNYLQEVEAWRSARIGRLNSPSGWLTLVGLFPLADGDNGLGSAPENDCVFPGGAPARVGTARLAADGVRFVAAPGVIVWHDSAQVDSIDMVPDPEAGAVVLKLADRFEFLHIVRAGRHYLRLKDGEAQALKEFPDSISHYPVNVAWRIEGRWETYDPPRKASIPNVLGFDTETPMTGAAVFEWNGQTVRLEPDEAGDSYFFVFGDATNGDHTYGGGRFVYADPPDSSGLIVIDFNKAYNPPCVFSPYATCPLPRPENKLPFAVDAGEKMYGHAH